MAAADNPAHLQSACAASRAAGYGAAPALPRRPGIFYSGAGAARPLIYLREGRQEHTPSQPLPSLPLKVQ